MSTATVQQIGQDLAGWLASAQRGESITITDGGREIARLVPPERPAAATDGGELPQPVRKHPFDLKEVREALDALYDTSKHIRVLEMFVLYAARYEPPSEDEMREAFWDEERWGNVTCKKRFVTTIEAEAERALWILTHRLPSAIGHSQGWYGQAIFFLSGVNGATERISSEPEGLQRENDRRDEQWLKTVVRWTADALAKVYAEIGQEDQAWRDIRADGKIPEQTSNFLAQCMVGELNRKRDNPFPEFWNRYRNDKSLRSRSTIRDFIKENLSRRKAFKIAQRAAWAQGCTIENDLGWVLWTSAEFEEGWPHFKKHLIQRIKDYNQLRKLTLKNYESSERWAGEFKEYMALEGATFEDRKRSLMSFNGWFCFRDKAVEWPRMAWLKIEWRTISTACKKAAKTMLCEPEKKSEWQVQWVRKRELKPGEGEKLILPMPEWARRNKGGG